MVVRIEVFEDVYYKGVVDYDVKEVAEIVIEDAENPYELVFAEKMREELEKRGIKAKIVWW